MDEYDVGHIVDYNKIINVYRNSDIDKIIECIIPELGSTMFVDEFVSTLKHQVHILRNSLEILDSRSITCISSRICHMYTTTNGELQSDWYLVNVWRGRQLI